jgi:hypothetical protein
MSTSGKVRVENRIGDRKTLTPQRKTEQLHHRTAKLSSQLPIQTNFIPLCQAVRNGS